MKSVCVLDYGSGNVASVSNLLEFADIPHVVSNKPDEMRNATHIVLPGVGAFPSAMRKIQSTIPIEVLESEVLTRKKPFLGICVGMQVLMDFGTEFKRTDGFGWIQGGTEKLDSGELTLPHMGWNSINFEGTNPLLNGIEPGMDFYFVHSFAVNAADSAHVLATTEYGVEFCSMIQRENIYGVQFHPEKSQRAGMKLVQNFFDLGQDA